MNDSEYKSQLGWHAGFYFFLTNIIAISLVQGWREVFALWNALYLIGGTFLASVIIGNLNFLLTSLIQKRVNEKHSDLTMAEAVFGSARMQKIADQGRVLGNVMTLVAIAIAVACYLAFWQLSGQTQTTN